MSRCFLALGSNLGDREAHIRAGLEGLAVRGIKAVRCASNYSTEPLEMVNQPWFFNTVVEVETALEPDGVMSASLAVEQDCGRRRSAPNGPRTLDIDIILFGDRIVRTPTLTIPHPRFAIRRFVLEPLCEIAPGAIDPVTGLSIAARLAALVDESVVIRSGPPLCS
jgi:2-amino-4-hydroxy-6-hydroxymethyldihydropteridine diphosphokinase